MKCPALKRTIKDCRENESSYMENPSISPASPTAHKHILTPYWGHIPAFLAKMNRHPALKRRIPVFPPQKAALAWRRAGSTPSAARAPQARWAPRSRPRSRTRSPPPKLPKAYYMKLSVAEIHTDLYFVICIYSSCICTFSLTLFLSLSLSLSPSPSLCKNIYAYMRVYIYMCVYIHT